MKNILPLYALRTPYYSLFHCYLPHYPNFLGHASCWLTHARRVSCSSGFESSSLQQISWWVATWDGTRLRANLYEGQQRRKLWKKNRWFAENKERKKNFFGISSQTNISKVVILQRKVLRLVLNSTRLVHTEFRKFFSLDILPFEDVLELHKCLL